MFDGCVSDAGYSHVLSVQQMFDPVCSSLQSAHLNVLLSSTFAYVPLTVLGPPAAASGRQYHMTCHMIFMPYSLGKKVHHLTLIP